MDMTMNRRTPIGVLVALACGSVASVSAQTPPSADTKAKVERIEVTGSNIKRVDAESTVPIQIITQEEIRRSGRQTVTELLRELPINAAGGLTELTGSGSFSVGAASISLRGLGSTSTLVLLNGRRIAPYGLADPNFGQSGVVNLNSIPLDAIERIEILKDGASAIYGSEAIAGVVNIILRKDYRGGQLAAGGSINKEGEYRSQNASASFGFGDLAKDRYNAFVNLEAYKQDSVLLRDVEGFLNRQQFRDGYSTGVASSSYSPFLTYISNATGGTVPSAGATCPATNVVDALPIVGVAGRVCLYDQWTRTEVVPKSDRQSIFARGTIDLSPTTQIYGEASFIRNSVFFKGTGQTVGQGTGATFNSVTGRPNPAATGLAIGHPNNPFNRVTTVRARMDAVGFQDNEVESETKRAVVGVKTVLGRFDFEGGALYSRNDQEVTNYNSLRYDRLVQAFGFTVVPNAVGNPTLVANPAGGFFNWASPNSGAVTADQIRYTAKDEAYSKFTIIDAKLSGEIGALPGGAAMMALGLEHRKEERRATPDAQKVLGNIAGRGITGANGERSVNTLFGEVSLPLAKNLEAQVAARYDRYSDFGSSVTPKVSAAWTPISSLKIRGSFARGFRAPSLTEISRSSATGFFNNIDDPRRCNRAANITSGCGISIPGIIVASPSLQPEKAQSYTAGAVWDLTQSTNLSVDYFSVSRRNEITFVGIIDVLNNELSTNPLYANRVVRDAANTNSAIPNDPGAIQFVNLAFTNLGETRVRGVDIDARHRISLGGSGRLTLNAALTHYIDARDSSAAGEPLISTSGYRNSPEWRGQFRAAWEIGSWTHTSAVNFVGPFKSFTTPERNTGTNLAAIRDCSNVNGTYLGYCTVATYVTVDAGTEYRGFKNWRINLVVRNLTNARPSADPLARPFNVGWYQPQGLNLSFGARYSWN
jgi:iron complex outermembrane receptor protein